MYSSINNTKKWYGPVGVLILLFFLTVALFAGFLSPHELKTSYQPYLPISRQHLLGTNDMGYDIFTELLHSARISLGVGIAAALISVVVGTTAGLLAGYYKGVLSEVVVGIIDIFLLVPFLPLVVMLAAYLGASFWNIVLVIGLLGWCSTARVVRARAMQLRSMPFVESLKSLGIPDTRIIVCHVLPNASEVIAAKFVLSVAGAMLSEASLSFLGLGDPAMISWGMMIHYAFKRGGFVNGMWHWYLPPGLCIAMCAMGFVLLGLLFEARGERLSTSCRQVEEIFRA